MFTIILVVLTLQHVQSCVPTGSSEKPVLIRCQMCAQNLITKGSAVATDSTSLFQGCSVRTFACPNNEIQYNSGKATKGPLETTCNAAGTAWLHDNVPVSEVSCTTPSPTPSPACKNCAQSLIKITILGTGARPMNGDLTITTGACAVRTFTCTGTVAGNPRIQINGGPQVILDGEDGSVDGSAHLSVTCNGDGTAWEHLGGPIHEVQCAQ